MKCPYCGKEMERGALVSGHGIHWHKEQPGSMPLTKTTVKGFFKGLAEGFPAEADHCPDCKKFILSHE